MRHLQRTFAGHFDRIERHMDEDADFRGLCTDYERVAGMIEYLKLLVEPPRDGIRRQIESERLLLRELESEIRAFLASEANTQDEDTP